ncbi:MAG: ATP-binding protein [Acidimicrobiaceae bacterium]|nr:ATP-binding protein [Acidimicrobiaceae bacterium]
MATTNRDRINRTLDLLRDGLGPFVERELLRVSKVDVTTLAERYLPDDRINRGKPPHEWDTGTLLKAMWDTWQSVFHTPLGHSERSLVSELRNVRNNAAHQQTFSFDDTYRALDSAERLLNAVSAAEQADEIARSKAELLRLRHEEQSRTERKKATEATVSSQGSVQLPPWRDVVAPHDDVARGVYQNAEFAADLWQVYLGGASSEYQDPREFFARTYLTESLRALLRGALQRLSGKGGDPVIQLQTNFGGGKTHSMLALYHLVSGAEASSLPGIEEIVKEEGFDTLPLARRVVLVGTKISPATPLVKPDGTTVRTLWGELAYQLGGAEAYALVAEDDEHATSPGDVLRTLMNAYGPCVILVDEWVAYARQLHDDFDLTGGNFDTQFTFAQALTEAASAADTCLLVVSLPASDTGSSANEDIEVGGERGRSALARLRNAVGRVETSWRPANAEESFEIVRRRLFSPLTEREQFVARDAVAAAFGKLYKTNPEAFPTECGFPEYEKRLRDAYPIHPEVFDHLYGDWSTLPKFQRTRGVLRLMAAVIHALWANGNRDPLILPAHLPLDHDAVRSELTRYLPDNWNPIIDADVDGPASLPVRLDATPEFGRYLAARRVSRTIFLATAPTTQAANRGIDDRQVRLGAVMPGEPPAKITDALRRLTHSATYLYNDQARYWFDTQPTVTKLVTDRSLRLQRDQPDEIYRELRARLVGSTGNEFAGVHHLPDGGADIPDLLATRLVTLRPEDAYLRTPDDESPAQRRARDLVESRGTAPRTYRNALVFLAPDQARYDDLKVAICDYLAWFEVLNDREALNLTPSQVRQAEAQREAANHRLDVQLPETYCWLIVPTQASPKHPLVFAAHRLTTSGTLDTRAKRKLVGDGLLAPVLGATTLRQELDGVPLWSSETNSVPIAKLVEYFASYPYLTRLSDPSVLHRAIESGVSQLMWQTDTFAYAESYDGTTQRFLGLRGGESLTIHESDPGLVVRADVAAAQLERDVLATSVATEATGETDILPVGQGGEDSAPAQSVLSRPRRYHATVHLDPERASKVTQIYQEVIAHLVSASLRGVTVTLTLEIEASSTEGFSDGVVRVVSENGNTLGFSQQSFEER